MRKNAGCLNFPVSAVINRGRKQKRRRTRPLVSAFQVLGTTSTTPPQEATSPDMTLPADPELTCGTPPSHQSHPSRIREQTVCLLWDLRSYERAKLGTPEHPSLEVRGGGAGWSLHTRGKKKRGILYPPGLSWHVGSNSKYTGKHEMSHVSTDSIQKALHKDEYFYFSHVTAFKSHWLKNKI